MIYLFIYTWVIRQAAKKPRKGRGGEAPAARKGTDYLNTMIIINRIIIISIIPPPHAKEPIMFNTIIIITIVIINTIIIINRIIIIIIITKEPIIFNTIIINRVIIIITSISSITIAKTFCVSPIKAPAARKGADLFHHIIQYTMLCDIVLYVRVYYS